MVKGISRQVIVVHAPEPKLFEQAIFILKNEAVSGQGITDEALLKEAKTSIMEQLVLEFLKEISIQHMLFLEKSQLQIM